MQAAAIGGTGGPARSGAAVRSTIRPERGTALIKAVLASFSVYLLPQFSFEPRVLPFAVMLAEMVGEVRGREPLFAASMVVAALVLQVLAAALFYWMFLDSFRRRAWVLVLAVPGFIVFTEWAYMSTLPQFFLIRSDPAPERDTLPLNSLFR